MVTTLTRSPLGWYFDRRRRTVHTVAEVTPGRVVANCGAVFYAQPDAVTEQRRSGRTCRHAECAKP